MKSNTNRWKSILFLGALATASLTTAYSVPVAARPRVKKTSGEISAAGPSKVVMITQADPKTSSNEDVDSSVGTPLYRDALAVAAKLKDIPFAFDPVRLGQVQDARHLLQAFPEYYFQLVNENKKGLDSLVVAEEHHAWCAGGVSPEDFGAAIRGDAASVFTVNDVLKSGPCPIAFEFFQFLVGARFVDPSTRLDDLASAYLKGINGESLAAPHLVNDLLHDSVIAGMWMDPNHVGAGNHLLREPGIQEVTVRERQALQAALDQFFPRKIAIVDAVHSQSISANGTAKSNVSAYQLLLENRGQILEVELTPEVRPVTQAVAASETPSLNDRMTTVFTVERGGVSVYEGAVSIGKTAYVIRPRFRGDIPVSLPVDEPSEIHDLLHFEAYTLGQIHSKTLNEPGGYSAALRSIAGRGLARDLTAVMIFLEHKFNQQLGTLPNQAINEGRREQTN